MALYRPTELIAFLESIGAAPRKQLSQNFLIDGNIIQNILLAAEVSEGDAILEIGPGPGSLTEALLNKGARVVAVETDRKLASALERLQTSDNRLQVITADALKAPLADLLDPFQNYSGKIKLISNLPYHITTPLLERFIPEWQTISTIVVMVQNEVAKRMCGSPSTKEYGSLTLFLNFYAKVSYAFKVKRTCFFPAPNVDSAVVKLELKKPEEGIDETEFFKMTRQAFGQRRKALRKSLKDLYPNIEETLLELNLAPLTRPEELSLDQFIRLYQFLLNRRIK